VTVCWRNSRPKQSRGFHIWKPQ